MAEDEKGNEMKQKKVLVLMSTYNGEKYIKRQIESIEKQKTDCLIDILIRDDGSTDSTVNIVKTLMKKYNNIKLVAGHNVGFNKSFFELFRMADGYDYYAISDQDDIWINTKIQKSIRTIEKEGEKAPILFGACSYIVNDKKEKIGLTSQANKELTLKNTIIQNIVPGHSQVFNNKMLDFLKTKNDISQIYVYDYWITNLAMLFGKVYFSNDPLVEYRIHDSNSVGYGKNKMEWAKERLRRIKNGDGKKMTNQIKYFYAKFEKCIDIDSKKEIEKFINSRDNFLRRLKFVFSTRLYRQKRMETVLFKLTYLFGGF